MNTYREEIGRARIAGALMIAAVLAALVAPNYAQNNAAQSSQSQFFVTDEAATAVAGE